MKSSMLKSGLKLPSLVDTSVPADSSESHGSLLIFTLERFRSLTHVTQAVRHRDGWPSHFRSDSASPCPCGAFWPMVHVFSSRDDESTAIWVKWLHGCRQWTRTTFGIICDCSHLSFVVMKTLLQVPCDLDFIQWVWSGIHPTNPTLQHQAILKSQAIPCKRVTGVTKLRWCMSLSCILIMAKGNFNRCTPHGSCLGTLTLGSYT